MGTHQFIHIGDLHLGPGPRNPDRLRALDQIIGEGLQLDDLAAWLLPGDLNHGRMTIDDRNALATRLQAMAQRAPVIITPGNHDLPGDLDVFARLAAPWPIHVVSSPQVLSLHLATGPAAIFCLPYPTRAGLVAAGTPSDQIYPAAYAALEAIITAAAAELQEAQARGAVTLMIGHVNVAGAISSVGQPQIGREIELDQLLLARLGRMPKLLNHIHAAQEFPDVQAWYAGSVCRMDYGETEAKRYLRAVFCPSADKSGGAWTTDGAFEYFVSTQPIDVAPMYHIEGDLTRDGFTWAVTAGPGGEPQPAPASWEGCDVRVRFRFPASERSVVSDAEIRATFADAARLALDPVAVPDRAVRAPQVAQARTLSDKLRAWADETGAGLTTGVLEKLVQLEHAPPEQVLSDVAARVDPLIAAPDATPVRPTTDRHELGGVL